MGYLWVNHDYTLYMHCSFQQHGLLLRCGCDSFLFNVDQYITNYYFGPVKTGGHVITLQHADMLGSSRGVHVSALNVCFTVCVCVFLCVQSHVCVCVCVHRFQWALKDSSFDLLSITERGHQQENDCQDSSQLSIVVGLSPPPRTGDWQAVSSAGLLPLRQIHNPALQLTDCENESFLSLGPFWSILPSNGGRTMYNMTITVCVCVLSYGCELFLLSSSSSLRSVQLTGAELVPQPRLGVMAADGLERSHIVITWETAAVIMIGFTQSISSPIEPAFTWQDFKT